MNKFKIIRKIEICLSDNYKKQIFERVYVKILIENTIEKILVFI